MSVSRPFISYTKYDLGYQFEVGHPNEKLLYEIALRLCRETSRTVKLFTVLLQGVGYTPSQIMRMFGFDPIAEINLRPNVIVYTNNMIPNRPYIRVNKYELGTLLEPGNLNSNVLYEIYCRICKEKSATIRFFGPILHVYGLTINDLIQQFRGE